MVEAELQESLGTDTKLTHILTQITDIRSLSMLGAVFPLVPKQIPKELIDETCKFSQLSDVQIAALGLLIRVKLEPGHAYSCLMCIIRSSRFEKLGLESQFTICMKLIRAAVLCHKLHDLYQTKLIQNLYQKNANYFQAPFLYLSAEAREASDVDPVLTKIVRNDVMATYYAGINKLLLKQYELADRCFIHAWILSKGAKDIRPSIVPRLFLSAFLSGKTLRVLWARVPKKYVSDDAWYLKIWSLEPGYRSKVTQSDPIVQILLPEICAERARRVVLDLCQNVSKILVSELDKMVEGSGISVLKKLQESGDITFGLEKDIVSLKYPLIGQKITTHLRELQGN